jgi:hypothetical protein
MTPELNAWRLRTERHYEKDRGKRHLFTVVRLWDENGALIGLAQNTTSQNRLWNKWLDHNQEIPTEELPVSKELRREVAAIMLDAKKRGFPYRYTLHATARNKKTGEHRYGRYEIFKATPWARETKRGVRGFFNRHMPRSNIGIFVYHEDKLFAWPRLVQVPSD